jgi:O-antigen/teichoic acid export membrane protein
MYLRSAISNLKNLANRHSVGAATSFSMQVLGAALSFLFSLLLAKLIGASGLGLYFLSVTTVEIFSTVSRLGLETAALKFISIARATGDDGTLAALYRKCIGIAALTAAVTALPAWLFLRLVPVGGSSHSELLSLVPFVLLALVPVTVLAIQSESFRAIGYPGTAAFFQTVLPQATLLFFGAMLMWRSEATLGNILASYAIAFYLTVAFAFGRWASIVRNVWREGTFPTAALFRTSLPVLVVTSLNLVMAWTDILILGIWSDAEQIGIYGIALRISATPALIIMAINSVVAPEFAALYAGGRHSDLSRMVQRGAFWSLALAAPPILAFLIFPAEILALFGQQFVAGTWSLRLLALAQLVNASTGQITSLLIMTGHEKWMRNNILFSASLNLAGNLLLVPLLGGLGAALSTAICIVLLNVIGWWLVRQKLQIDAIGYMYPHAQARFGPK